jgi:hypothetical protein
MPGCAERHSNNALGREEQPAILSRYAMNKKQRLSGFKALLESEKSNSFYLEDADGNLRLWRELSAEGKLQWIVRDAAYYDVPFEPFAEAVRESVGNGAIEEAALRLALRSGRELHALEKLFPDDGRNESAPPLVERVAELLDAQSLEHESDAVLSCEKLAALFKEMRADEAAGKLEDAHRYDKEAVHKTLEEKTNAPAAEKAKDKDIER